MHLVLTDKLTCPRCGPKSGLILLAERIQNRRVLEGSLDCADCMARYPVRGGFADLRPQIADRERIAADASEIASPPEPGSADAAVRLAALLGVTEGTGFIVVAGPGARLAPGIADRIEGIEVVTVDPALEAWPERTGVSRVGIDPSAGLPFKGYGMRAVGLTGPAAAWPVEEAARVLSPVGRLVLDGAPADAADRLRRARLEIAARDESTIVARPLH